jgi:hypothetical protein
MLDRLPRFFSAGELRRIWKQGVLTNDLCSCGEVFRACPFWRRVGEEAFGGWDNVDAAEVVAFDQRFVRIRFLPLLLAPGIWPGFRARRNQYRDVVARLYRAVYRVSGGSIVVDTSKDPVYLLFLRGLEGVDVRGVHLVRDSRGVAYSCTKEVYRPGPRGTRVAMNRFRPGQVGPRWCLTNIAFRLLGLGLVPQLFVRYEQLSIAPKRHLGHVITHVGEHVEEDDLSFLHASSFDLADSHTFVGNPLRFRRGAIPIRVDDEWREKLDPNQRRLVSLLTWPFLLRYGYLSRPKGLSSQQTADIG